MTPASLHRRQPGFTLLEVVVAMAILGLALMALFDLNAGALTSHVYARNVTIAAQLARGKMIDLEHELYDEGFPNDDDELDGDFSEEGWEVFTWRALILVPDTDGVTPEQLLSAATGMPLGALTGGLDGEGGSEGDAAGGADALGGLGGMMGGLAQGQMGQFLTLISENVREVHLTVSWQEQGVTETLDLVTHFVADAQGGGLRTAEGSGASAGAPGGNPNNPGDPNNPGQGSCTGGNLVNIRTCQPVPNPVEAAPGRCIDPASGMPAVPPDRCLSHLRNRGRGGTR